MCSPARCRRCGNTTWSGCGRHVDAVMSRVPADKRCTCAAATPPGPPRRQGRPSWLSRLRGEG